MSAEAKFTPGPWTVRREEATRSMWVEAAGRTVAAPQDPETREEEAQAIANAHLIAAAPDLYAALSRVLGTIADECSEETFQMAVAALAKARGEK